MPVPLPFRIEAHDVLPSTQTEMRRRVDAGLPVHGLVLRATRQTEASGTRGRAWVSGPGGSYQTLAVRDAEPPRLRRGLTAVAIALGIAEALRTAGVRARVKWPNDLWYADRKLGGVLAEFRAGHVLVGVGVNVTNPVPEGATALGGWDLEGVHLVVLQGMQIGLDAVWDGLDLTDRFSEVDALRGRRVRVAVGSGTELEGVGDGLDGDGCLRLRNGARVTRVCHGTVRDHGPATPDPGAV